MAQYPAAAATLLNDSRPRCDESINGIRLLNQTTVDHQQIQNMPRERFSRSLEALLAGETTCVLYICSGPRLAPLQRPA